jgi:hypothetical protein
VSETKPPAPSEYVRRNKLPPPEPPPMRTQAPRGIDWMPLTIIGFAVMFGVFAGIAMAGC